jgi:hypothetical protein
MPRQSRFIPYIKSREGGFSLFVVIACGLTLAFFYVTTFLDPLPRLYQLDFGSAKWIQSTTPAQHNFFRKTLYIPGTVDRAWMYISATDRYALIVNGNKVDDRTFFSACVAHVYDLKLLLKPGKNVIAIDSDRYSFPGSPQVLVRGFYGVVGSPLQEFVSSPFDQSWRASNTPDGILGGYKWYARELDDSFWKLPVLAPASERPSLIEQVQSDPRLYATKPTAKWIAPPEGSSRQASFSYELQVPTERQETWLQIAATGNYDFFLNGRLITTQAVAPKPFLSPQLPNTQPALRAYEISRWLHTGANSILVRVSSQTLQPALLLAEGYTVLDGKRVGRFVTDAGWKTVLHSKDARPATVVAEYGYQPWGMLQQEPAGPLVTPIYDLQKILVWVPMSALIIGGTVLFWIIVSSLVAPLVRQPVEKLWTCDAIFHLCVLLGLLFLWLLAFDVRFPVNWCFRPRIVWLAIDILAIGKLLLLLPRSRAYLEKVDRAEPQRKGWLAHYWKGVVLALIVILGFFLRARDFTTMSLDVDEFGVSQYSQGIQKKGYPFIQLGSFEKEVTTYELVSYSVATARQFLGECETAYRLPALIYGTLTIAVIGIAGTRMMGWRVGLTAAFIFATFPAGLFWGKNAFWPSQEQFFSIITFWTFYEAIKVRGGPLRHGFLTVAAVGFIFSYLTWEGSGFILPTLFACMFTMQWARYEWMRDWHLWRCCVVMSFAVGIQLTHRQVASPPAYLQTGISLSDVTTPVPVWFDVTHYDPQYYFSYTLFAENYVIITLLFIFGIWFCWRDRAIRYLAVSTIMMLMWYMEFLPAYAVRYSYDYQTLLILASVGILFKLCDRVAGLGATRLRGLGAGALFLMYVLSTNGFVLNLYRLSRTGPTPFYGERMGIYRTDYRGAAQYVARHFQPGDGLIVAIPHIFEFYSHLSVNYSINTMLDKKITYSGVSDRPQFLDKFRGHPCVRSLEELEDLRTRFKRLWIVQVPLGPADNQNPAVVAYLQKNARVAFLSYKAEVDLLVATPYSTSMQEIKD